MRASKQVQNNLTRGSSRSWNENPSNNPVFWVLVSQTARDNHQYLFSGNIQDSFLCDVTDSSFFKQLFSQIYFKSSLSPCCLLSLFFLVMFLKSRHVTLTKKHKSCGRHVKSRRGEERSSKLPSQVWFCVFLFLLANTELVKVSAAKDLVQPPLAPFQKERCLFQKNGRDKPVRGALAFCTFSHHPLSLLGIRGSDRSQDFNSALLGSRQLRASSALTASDHLLAVHVSLDHRR